MPVWSTITHKLDALGLIPHTRLARFALYLTGLEALLLALQIVLSLFKATVAASALSGWIVFVGWVAGILLFFLALRWFRDHVMWSVRNRLIVTYLFIGGLPVGLMAVMAFGSGYVLAQHLATFLAVSEVRVQQQRLASANLATIEEMERHKATPEKISAENVPFAGRSITILKPGTAPAWLKDGFSGLVSDHDKIYLRAVNSFVTPRGPALVVSSVPFDTKLLALVANKLGSLTLSSTFDFRGSANAANDDRQTDETITRVKVAQQHVVTAGTVAAPRRSLDWEFRFGGLIQSTNWETGEPQTNLFLSGSTRLSTVLANLSESMSFWSGIIGVVLVGAAILFAVVVLVALLIGVGLTRKITYSVANLYKATQFINRGDFTQRIQVREKDQLAALQVSFNSMTDSLQQLIAEQKEKERLQSELEIAHEVQAQLFPGSISGTRSLELFGICRPARIVSGDYYDFLAYGPDQVGIAVGDISGKGISAALLMATIHSAVRAYEQQELLSAGSVATYGTHSRTATVLSRVAPSPAHMLWLLNRHLFESTQPEKYATLFLGFYEEAKHQLTYANAGHLPPIVLAKNGTVRRLETGGTVVGLFPDCDYEEETVELYPGDIFIAFSDGITEPENEFGEFGEDRLLEAIVRYRDLPLERITEHAVSAVQDWIGSTEQPDDITLVLARRI